MNLAHPCLRTILKKLAEFICPQRWNVDKGFGFIGRDQGGDE